MTDPTPDSPVAPGEVTQLLAAIESGKVRADQLLPLVYRELKRLAVARMANERVDHTLQPTALVHEAYVRLIDSENAKPWDSRATASRWWTFSKAWLLDWMGP